MSNVLYSTGTAPLNPNEGDMYYDTVTNRNNIYHKGSWFELKFTMPKRLERIEKIKAILN